MAPPDRASNEKVLDDLSELDRAWLEEQLVRYWELLEYLHDH